LSTSDGKLEKFLKNPGASAKDMIQATLLKSSVPVSQIAAAMGKSDDRLYKSANRNNLDQHLHFKDIPILINESGDFTILHELAEMFGFLLFPVDDAKKLIAVSQSLRIGKSSRED
jgi:hypothetical protein